MKLKKILTSVKKLRCIINFGFNLKEDVFEFYVKDTGVGIEEKYLDQIFDRFTRIHQKEKVIEGNGLSLSIVMSAHVFGDEKNKAIEYGADSFIDKPVNRDELKEVLSNYIDFA